MLQNMFPSPKKDSIGQNSISGKLIKNSVNSYDREPESDSYGEGDTSGDTYEINKINDSNKKCECQKSGGNEGSTGSDGSRGNSKKGYERSTDGGDVFLIGGTESSGDGYDKEPESGSYHGGHTSGESDERNKIPESNKKCECEKSRGNEGSSGSGGSRGSKSNWHEISTDGGGSAPVAGTESSGISSGGHTSGENEEIPKMHESNKKCECQKSEGNEGSSVSDGSREHSKKWNEGSTDGGGSVPIGGTESSGGGYDKEPESGNYSGGHISGENEVRKKIQDSSKKCKCQKGEENEGSSDYDGSRGNSNKLYERNIAFGGSVPVGGTESNGSGYDKEPERDSYSGGNTSGENDGRGSVPVRGTESSGGRYNKEHDINKKCECQKSGGNEGSSGSDGSEVNTNKLDERSTGSGGSVPVGGTESSGDGYDKEPESRSYIEGHTNGENYERNKMYESNKKCECEKSRRSHEIERSSDGQCNVIGESSEGDESSESSESSEGSESSENSAEDGDGDDGSFKHFHYHPMNGPTFCYCGAPNTQHMDAFFGEDYIRGGDVTEDYEYPWQVSLLYYIKKPCNTGIPLTARANCGGTLVTDLHVITAAHCLKVQGTRHKVKDIKILLGESNLLSDNDNKMIVGAKEFKIPERGQLSDIAVIELNKRVSLTQYPNIKPACLPVPKPGETRPLNGWYQNKIAIMSGWGRNSSIDPKHKSNSKPTRLKELHVRVVGRKNCGNFSKWHTFNKDNSSYLFDSLFCGYSGGEGDSCKGDSGGPLITNDEDNLGAATLIGLVSLGYETCNSDFPYQIYTSVKYFLMESTGWLNESLKGGKICPSYPGGIWSKNLDDPTQNRLHPINVENGTETIENNTNIIETFKNGSKSHINHRTGEKEGWIKHEGKDCYGGHGADDIMPSPYDNSISLQQCKAVCLNHIMCEGIVRVAVDLENPGICWLRKNINVGNCYSDRNFTIYVKPGDSLCKEDNIVYEGQDIGENPKIRSDEEKCHKYCEKISNCEVWVLNKKSKICVLKSFKEDLERKKNNAFVSGLKNCYTENGTQSEGNVTQSKVNGTQSEGNVTQSKVNGTQIEGNVTQSKVNGTQSEGNVTQSKVNGTQSEVNVTQSKVTGTENKVNVTKEIPGDSLCKEDNIVYVGQDIGEKPKIRSDEEKCHKYCKNISKCEVWVLHKKSKVCILKSFKEDLERKNDNAFVSGLKDCYKGDYLCKEDNILYDGQDIGEKPIIRSDEEKCHKYCGNISKCEVWVLHKKNKICLLKSFKEDLERKNNNAFVSGLKDCFKGNKSQTDGGLLYQIESGVLVEESAGGSLCTEDNAVYLGQDVSDTGRIVSNEQECNKYCEEVSECDVWVYHKKIKTCQLKIFHDHLKKENNNVYASGLKDCSKGVPIYCKDKVLQDKCELNKKLKGKMKFNPTLNNNCKYCETGITPSSLKGSSESIPADKNILKEENGYAH